MAKIQDSVDRLSQDEQSNQSWEETMKACEWVPTWMDRALRVTLLWVLVGAFALNEIADLGHSRVSRESLPLQRDETFNVEQTEALRGEIPAEPHTTEAGDPLSAPMARMRGKELTPSQASGGLLSADNNVIVASEPRPMPLEPAVGEALATTRSAGTVAWAETAVLEAGDPRHMPAELTGSEELTAWRTENSATFKTDGGGYAAVQDVQPLHYQDDAGRWQPISPAFQTVENGWVNRTNTVQTSVSRASSDAKITAAGAGVGWEPQSLMLTGVGHDVVLASPAGGSTSGSGALNEMGNRVAYAGGWTDAGIQDAWQVDSGSTEYTLQLSEPPVAEGRRDPSVPNGGGPRHVELRVLLHLAPGTALEVEGAPVRPEELPLDVEGEIGFAAGDAVLWLLPPQVHEARAPEERVGGCYVLAPTDDPTTMELQARLPYGWFVSEERSYPVVIDPLFQMESGTIVKAPAYGWVSTAWDKFLGYTSPPSLGRWADGQSRLLVKFELPTQPPGTDVTQAYLIATPTGETFPTETYLTQNVWAHRMRNDDWIHSSDVAHLDHRVHETIGLQTLSFTEGGPPGSGTWDMTEIVQEWYDEGTMLDPDLQPDPHKMNNGIMLWAENEFCTPNVNGCGCFLFDPLYAWSTDDLLEIEENSTEEEPHYPELSQGYSPGSPKGGVRLLVFFSGPTLSEGHVIEGPFGSSLYPPSVGEPYFHADHEYRLTDPTPAHWQAVVARGLGQLVEPEQPQAGDPRRQELKGQVDLELYDTDDHIYLPADENDKTLRAEEHLNYVLLNGRMIAGRRHHVRVPPRTAPTGDAPESYDIRLIGEEGVLAPQFEEGEEGNSVTTTYQFDTHDPAALWHVDLSQVPATSNVRVGVEIYQDNTTGSIVQGEYYHYAGKFKAQLHPGTGRPYLGLGSTPYRVVDPRGGDYGYRAVEYGSVKLSSSPFSPDQTAGESDYALALTYHGPGIDFYNPGPGPKVSSDELDVLRFACRIRVTACRAGTFPTSGGECQRLECPDRGTLAAWDRRQSFDLQLWSKAGWNDPLPDGSVSSPADAEVMPLIGAPGDVAPTVAVLEGQITYVAPGSVALSDDSMAMLVNCGTLDNPPETAGDTFAAYLGAMEGGEHFWDRWLEPSGQAEKPLNPLVSPWVSADEEDLLAERSRIYPVSGELRGYARLRRLIEGTDYDFNVYYTLDVEGWPSFDPTVAPGTLFPAAPTVASMVLDFGDTFTLDVTELVDKTTPREIHNVRAPDATISLPPNLGGATKPVQALIFPRGIALPTEPDPRGCMGSCLDLRGLGDTFGDAQRRWQMPDVHTNVHAGTVIMQSEGHLEVYSVDHPATTQSISQEFSFDTFGGSVAVSYETCDTASKVIVIRGETRITIPNIGGGGSPDSKASATFKICETSLRQVDFTLEPPMGIPIGNSGLFATRLHGIVDLNPGYTTIDVDLAFQTGDGYTLQGVGGVTIDTRGYFEFQGTGTILGTVDAEGKLWVAWNPLDIGFEMTLRYGGWLEGLARAHMWEGQGWQHKYDWLPDNNDRHIASQFVATIRIKKGQAFSWWFIKIPPSTISFGIEIAFGEFCTNASCTAYEWGVKGKFSVAGYDVGLYYGFSHGFSFILGNDGHVLIDQYGGAMAQLGDAAADGRRGLAVQAASPAVNGVVTETLIMSPTTESLLVALGWREGYLDLKLLDADGVDVTTVDSYTVDVIWTPPSSLIMGVQLDSPSAQHEEWRAVISNVTGDEDYKFIYFASQGAPGEPGEMGRFLTPGPGVTEASDIYDITWEVQAGAPPSTTIGLYYTRYTLDPDTGLMPIKDLIDVPIVKNLPYADGSYAWNTVGLRAACPAGFDDRCYYWIRAVVHDGVNAFPVGCVSDPDDPCQPRPELPPDWAFNRARFPGISTFRSVGSLVFTDTDRPAHPTGLTLKGVDDAIMARWNPCTDRDLAAYLVRWGRGFQYTATRFVWISYKEQRVTSVLTPSLRLGGVENGTQYHVTVHAIDVNGNKSVARFGATPQSVTPSSLLGDQVPGRPHNLQVVSTNSTGASLSWYAAPLSGFFYPWPSGYRVTYRQLGGPHDAHHVDVPSKSATLTDLETGASYLVSVSAADADGWRSGDSPAIRVMVTDHTDTDGDGLPDDWAQAYGVFYHLRDDDRDGLTNGDELDLGSDPTVPDSDGDGFSDQEEAEASTDALNALAFPALFTQPRLELDTDRLVFHAKKGENPPSKPVVYSNSGGGTLDLDAVPQSPWIEATGFQLPPPSGYKGIYVGVDTAHLTPGYHTDVVRLETNAVDGPRCIRVELWLSPRAPVSYTHTVHLPVVLRTSRGRD